MEPTQTQQHLLLVNLAIQIALHVQRDQLFALHAQEPIISLYLIRVPLHATLDIIQNLQPIFALFVIVNALYAMDQPQLNVKNAN